ncbi:HDOD domain-containing protein [Vibrio penaeicida]|uniref:HDOD domain-containing protein n=1 Tax=Vibrio penaeicida TaxID=104609 RepID=UPI000CEA4B1F|nr:HDOD domain-containing protein [Vibrio penaeicida]
MTQLNILCIDDDQLSLRATVRTLRRLRPEWKIYSEVDSKAVLAHREQALPIHVVLTDMLMPHTNGETVLNHFKANHSHCIRALLTGDVDTKTYQLAHKYSHFVLSKPCQDDDYLKLLECTERLFQLPINDDFRAHLGKIDLPILTESVRRLKTKLKKGCTIQDAASIVAAEPSLAARIVQVANSAYLGFRVSTSDLSEAIARIGTDNLIDIAMTLLCEFKGSYLINRADHKEEADKAFQIATLAKSIASNMALPVDTQSNLFTAALMHSLGVIVCNHSDFLKQQDEKISGYTTTALVSSYLSTLWGMQLEISDTLIRCDKYRDTNDRNCTLSNILYISQKIFQMEKNDASKFLMTIDNLKLKKIAYKTLTLV